MVDPVKVALPPPMFEKRLRLRLRVKQSITPFDPQPKAYAVYDPVWALSFSATLTPQRGTNMPAQGRAIAPP